MHVAPFKLFFAAIMLFCGVQSLTAQSDNKPAPVSASATALATSKENATNQPVAPGTPVTIQENVTQSFRVEPVVLRFNGRRGELIPFEFTLTALGKDTQIELIPVNLKQELSGIIMPDLQSPAENILRLDSEKEFTLSSNGTQSLKGELTVPATKSNFLSYGILVREKQVQAEFKPAEAAGKVQAAVKFVTQYLLRVDVETEQSDEKMFREMELEEISLKSVDGLPMIHSILHNPTDTAFECRVQALLKAGSTSSKKPVFLTMGTRSHLENEERVLVKIMPHSKLALTAMPESAITPGTASLHVNVLNGRRAVQQAEKAMHISLGDYPALQAKFAELGNEMIASPAAIMMGQTKGGKHTLPFSIANFGAESQKLTLKVTDFAGNPMEELALSNTSLELAAGKTQTVRASIKSKKGISEPLHGWVKILQDDIELNAIPVSLLYAEPEPAKLDITTLTMQNQPEHVKFHCQVTNNSAGFTPLHCRIDYVDNNGRKHALQAGFGKVLHPGESTHLTFTGPTLPPGDVTVGFSILTFPNHPPLQRTQGFTIADQTAQK
jgi:hypothetical protein